MANFNCSKIEKDKEKGKRKPIPKNSKLSISDKEKELKKNNSLDFLNFLKKLENQPPNFQYKTSKYIIQSWHYLKNGVTKKHTIKQFI